MPRPSRLRRRLSPARWKEYRQFLQDAIEAGYRVEPLDRWIRSTPLSAPPQRVLMLRHDVDQEPGAVETMASIEEELGIHSTWYFRWRTADPAVIARLQRAGHATGLHYETLTRRANALGLGPADAWQHLVAPCREELTEEITTWALRHGRARSVCPHGDTAVPWITNAILMRGRRASDFCVEFDANDAMRGRELGHWLTDRSAAEGSWKDGIGPAALFDDGVGPILGVIHPNNWSAGSSSRRSGALSDEPPPR